MKYLHIYFLSMQVTPQASPDHKTVDNLFQARPADFETDVGVS